MKIRVCLAAFGCLLTAIAASASEPEDTWAKEPIYPIAGVSETLSDEDLAPLGRAIGNDTLVGLGESVHSSHGFYQAKFRLVKYLVEKKGFRAIAWETDWVPGQATADYIDRCEGSPDEALRGLYNENWWDSSVRNLFTWLCDYNRNHPGDKVRFFGFDIQAPKVHAAQLKEVFERYIPEKSIELLSGLDTCPEFKSGSLTPADHKACKKGLARLSWELWKLKGKISRDSSRNRYELLKLSISGLRRLQRASEFGSKGKLVERYEARDRNMADTFFKMKVLSGARFKKTIVWAHNTHLAREWEKALPVTFKYYGAKTMGAHLYRRYGPQFYILALMAYHVGISACQEKVGGRLPVPSTFPLSLEYTLYQKNLPHLYLNLEQAKNRKPYNKLMDVVNHVWTQQIKPVDQFDGIFFSQETTGGDLWDQCD